MKGGENMRTYRDGDYFPRDENECYIIGQEGTINAVVWVVNAFYLGSITSLNGLRAYF